MITANAVIKTTLQSIAASWKTDAAVDRTDPGAALLQVSLLHAKYLHLMVTAKEMARSESIKYFRMKRVKWEYYTGKLDQATLTKYGWEPFLYVLKSDTSIYMDSDVDLLKQKDLVSAADDSTDLCEKILKELNNRTWQLRSFIDYEKFLQGN